MKKRILVCAAHPDDEILGCGGTIARLVDEGAEVHTIILGEGMTSRDDERDVSKREDDLTLLKDHARKANDIIGVESVMFGELPDNRFDAVSLIDVIKLVETAKEKIKPEIIFTHHKSDLNIDHRVTYDAVLTATRPMKGENVKEIYSFEVMSSTEWYYPQCFSPNFFVDISGAVDKKLSSMEEYKTELRDYPHPRSLDAIKLTAKTWGVKVGVDYAEAFKLVRCLY